MSDSRMDGRILRTFNVIDDCDREVLGIEVDLSLPSAFVTRTLDQMIEWRGNPPALRCNNVAEYMANEFIERANKHLITLLCNQPGKQTQNAYIERFNLTARDEWLEINLFESVEHAQLLATKWRLT